MNGSCLLDFSCLGAELVQAGLGHIGALFSLIEFVLKLAELGEVGVGLLFGLLGLSLVGLDLDLELVDQVLDSVEVLLVLLALVGDLLHLSLELSRGLDAFGSSSLFGIKLVLELAHARLELLHLLSATLEGNLFSLVESELEVLDGRLHVLLHSLEVLALVLLLLELLGHHGGVGDGALGLLLGVSAFGDGLLDLALHLLQLGLELSLLVDERSAECWQVW